MTSVAWLPSQGEPLALLMVEVFLMSLVTAWGTWSRCARKRKPASRVFRCHSIVRYDTFDRVRRRSKTIMMMIIRKPAVSEQRPARLSVYLFLLTNGTLSILFFSLGSVMLCSFAVRFLFGQFFFVSNIVFLFSMPLLWKCE